MIIYEKNAIHGKEIKQIKCMLSSPLFPQIFFHFIHGQIKLIKVKTKIKK